MAEQKLTQEQIEEIKKAAVAEALAAQQTANAEGSGDNEKTEDGKKSFTEKVKDKAKGFWNLDLKLTPGKIVLAAVGIPAALLGIKMVYEKGVEAGKSEAEFCALPDNGTEPLALETTAQPQQVFEATVADLTDNFEVTEVEEL